jgi:penicillin-binding protein 1B
VGMIKGPTYYDPRRNPDNCLERRNLVLKTMVAHNLIGDTIFSQSAASPLIEKFVQTTGFNRFPAFLDLVRQQLADEYKEQDLKSDGLQILTTLDPRVQYQVEQSLKENIATLEKLPNCDNLEGAVTVTSRETGEVLAIAGGKTPVDHGFNRALFAKRPIGSLIKPAVYLTALETDLTLASPIEDSAITLADATGTLWSPENYDKKEHGRIPLYAGLANSYNLATVRLGMDIGLEKIIGTLQALGYREKIHPYPSLLLGAVDMSPLEVNQMYQTIGSGGFYTSLRAINSVMAADHSLLNRYGLAVEQRFSPETNYLLTHALQRVITDGTGKSLSRLFPRDHFAAGKTGTSNELRDSWFAGFTGDHLAVVWLGRDDNKPSALTGSTGSL